MNTALVSTIFRAKSTVRLHDATDFDSTLAAAREISANRENRNDVVVVVELGSEFNSKTGAYTCQRYNFYTYRGIKDFNQIANLKAAYVNGRRVDANDRANSGRLVQHAAQATSTQEIRIPDGDPLATGGRTRQRFVPVFDAPISNNPVPYPVIRAQADVPVVASASEPLSDVETETPDASPVEIQTESSPKIDPEALVNRAFAGRSAEWELNKTRRIDRNSLLTSHADLIACIPGVDLNKTRRLNREQLRARLMARMNLDVAPDRLVFVSDVKKAMGVIPSPLLLPNNFGV